MAVDSTMLEANAAMKSIERKDTDENWKDYLRRRSSRWKITNGRRTSRPPPEKAEFQRADSAN